MSEAVIITLEQMSEHELSNCITVHGTILNLFPIHKLVMLDSEF
jgi:hypothetical protein